jgi:hypothetical protein
MGVHAAVGVTCFGLAQHLGSSSGTHAPNLILQGDKSAPLVPEGLDLVPKLLSNLIEPSVAAHLRFGPLDYKLGSVNRVFSD